MLTSGQVRNKIVDMQTGDIIPCRYTATTAGVAGVFSELGTCTASEIPITGTPTPDGLFYFRKSDKGMLIADRVVQTNISWDTLNSAKFIQGSINLIDKVPTFTNPHSDFGDVTTNITSTTYPTFPAYKIFQQSLVNPFSHDSFLFSKQLPVWACLTLKDPIVFDRYVLECGAVNSNGNTRMISSWSVEASNDNGVTWTSLHSISNDTSWQYGVPKYYSFNNKIPYSMYRIYATAGGDSGEINIGRFRLSNSSCLIRSLTGGNAYLGTDGKASLTDKGLGAFPANNEWDKYIVKSDLNGTITAGDNNVWHWHEGVYSYHCDTPVIGLDASTSRVARGAFKYNGSWISEDIKHFSYGLSSGTGSHIGFRPALEYLEPNSKATTLFY